MSKSTFKVLLPEGKGYKANLHNHSHVSDSLITAEEHKKLYSENGYSIIAYTDHDVIIPHKKLIDEKFVALTSAELHANANKQFCNFAKTCHFNVVAIDEENTTAVLWHRNDYVPRCSMLYYDKVNVDESIPDYERIYSPEKLSEMFKICRDGGYFVIYNHPVWSCEDYGEYSKYENMHAFEIMNNSSIVGGYDEFNGNIYDEFLRLGKRIYCVAGDDNHNMTPPTDRKSDSLGTYTVIKASSLKYNDVTAALVNGDCYASEAPEIESIWYEDGFVHIKTSPCKKICLNTGIGRADLEIAESNDKPVTEATFKIYENDVYVRFSLTDMKGKRAYSRGYFTDEVDWGTEK